MPLKLQPAIRASSARDFVNFLVKRNHLKPGFKQVLGGRRLTEIKEYILTHQLFTAEELARLFAEYYQLAYFNLVDYPISPSAVKLLDRSVVERYQALPFELTGLMLTIAISDPTMLQSQAPNALTKLRQERGLNVRLVIVPEGDITAVLNKVYGDNQTVNASVTPAMSNAEESLVPDPVPAPAVLQRPELLKKVEGTSKEIDLHNVAIAPAVLQRIPYAVAKKYQLVVFEYQQPQSQFEPPMIKVALVHPQDVRVREILSYIEARNKVLVDRYHISESSFQAALARYPEATGEEEVVVHTEPHSKPMPAAPEPTVALPAVPKPPVPIPVAPLPTNPAPAAKQPILSVPVPPQPVAQSPNQAQEITASPDKPPVVSHQVAPAAEVPTPSLPSEDHIITLAPEDIINHPSKEIPTGEKAKIAEQQQAILEGQDLDQLLDRPILSVQDLAAAYKTGLIPQIVAATLFLAIRMKASDIHLETSRDYIRVRFRIDGILHDILRAPIFLHPPLVSRIKILSKMRIDEQRVPQDGRFDVIIDRHQIDLRVSTLPTIHGEKVVMRLLDKNEAMLTLEQLGLTGSNFDRLIENIRKPFGIILSTGPTGSGKSTTLYSILSRISKPGINIITLEDPVEYELPGLNQVQVMPQIGFTFADGLRSVLRQDPNVIMVGEIRDLETAAMATQSALTGHLVLSTLHTNDASGALPRLIDMGVEPFLITSSLLAVVGQRLVRRICPNCKESVTLPGPVLQFVKEELTKIPSGQLKNIDLNQLAFYHGRGCSECNDGYQGRIGIFEVLTMNREIENIAVRKGPTSEIQQAAIKNGMITMTQDGLVKALKGITTIDEILRVTTTSVKELPAT